VNILEASQLLEVNHLSKSFPAGGKIFKRRYLKAVDDVSFTISEDEASIISLAGESGSGKSTISKMILGIIKPTSGEIKYRGKNINRMSKQEWKTYRREVQAVFQDPYSIYNPFYRIDRVFKLPIKKFKLVSSKSEEKKLIDNSLEAVGLRPKDILGRYPHQLSGGERQRVMLTRLHLIKPRVLIADEPVSMIDVSLRSMFLNALLDFKKQHDMSTIFITHNLVDANFLGGKIIILYRGSFLEMGDARTVIKNPKHPYTKLMLTSLTTSDPDKRWQDKLDLTVSGITESNHATHGCRYADRCAMCKDECLSKQPQLEEIEYGHFVACRYGV
jgi:peptide/nickel transport system ATP-binding protein